MGFESGGGTGKPLFFTSFSLGFSAASISTLRRLRSIGNDFFVRSFLRSCLGSFSVSPVSSLAAFRLSLLIWFRPSLSGVLE